MCPSVGNPHGPLVHLLLRGTQAVSAFGYYTKQVAVDTCPTGWLAFLSGIYLRAEVLGPRAGDTQAVSTPPAAGEPSWFRAAILAPSPLLNVGVLHLR